MGCLSNQPLLAGGLTSGIKQKPCLAVSYCLCGDCEAARWRQKRYYTFIYFIYFVAFLRSIERSRNGLPDVELFTHISTSPLLVNGVKKWSKP
jgi:hypothetical protein